MASNRGSNRLEVPKAKDVLDKLKLEVASELGISNYDDLDKGNLPARLHGKIGGNMVRKLIAYAEQQMNKDENALQAVESMPGPNESDVQSVQESLQASQAIADSVQNIEQATNQPMQ